MSHEHGFIVVSFGSCCHTWVNHAVIPEHAQCRCVRFTNKQAMPAKPSCLKSEHYFILIH